MTFLITFVYVVATIFICLANIKSANATREQLLEQKRQFEEENRAFVTVTFEIIKSGLAVLHIQNHGKRIAKNVSIKIGDDFIQNVIGQIDKQSLQRLNNASFAIGIGQSWYVCIGSHLELKEMKTKILEITLSYNDDISKYCEHITIDFMQYFWSLIYDSPTEDIRKELKQMNKTMNVISKNIKNESE